MRSLVSFRYWEFIASMQRWSRVKGFTVGEGSQSMEPILRTRFRMEAVSLQEIIQKYVLPWVKLRQKSFGEDACHYFIYRSIGRGTDKQVGMRKKH
ncbi:hypothetical protein FGO68_gene8375 [Halteria grandinella]|uniref:Uncharacterized protein n=1 Tax=Halteria grandinella TaxID=5974 RepID=A0A8J8P0P5_HALGN|nr:hypothetical protein FGO68_gene8375 [Halteria grandinella]